MRDVVRTKAFRKEEKRAQRRGRDMAKLVEVVELLAAGKPLDLKYKAHPLKGTKILLWELHIAPDWLLIYYLTDDEVYLSMGTHADLFKGN
ncbi:MAG: type II toxin-antitoxin system YafQ family toxin [Deinococcota bacterium]